MTKPKAMCSKPYYDLIEVLNYIDDKIPRFKSRMWKELCNAGYINNDTITWIYWEGFTTKDTEEVIREGIEYMFFEFPDIKDGTVNFIISW